MLRYSPSSAALPLVVGGSCGVPSADITPPLRRPPVRRHAPCRLPLKPLVTGTIDLPVVIASSARRHHENLRVVAQVLGGSHEMWRRFDGARQQGRPVRSSLTTQQVSDMVRYGLAVPLSRRGGRRFFARAFTTPKSDGVTARPLYDARWQNALTVDAIPQAGFRLLDPFSHVSVGVHRRFRCAVRTCRPRIYTADATSYFPQFNWHRDLASRFAFRVTGGVFGHRVPVQGAWFMPWIAQSVSLAVADGPVPSAPRRAFRASRISVVYDNWLMSGCDCDLPGRVRAFRARCAAVGIRLGEDCGPAESGVACGFQFSEGKWRLKPTWAQKTAAWVHAALGDGEHVDSIVRATVAGLLLWAVRALLLPWWFIQPVLRSVASASPSWGLRERSAISSLVQLIERNPWREFLPRLPRESDSVIYVDSSLEAVGVRWCSEGHTYRWNRVRGPDLQQRCELEGVLVALRWLALRADRPRPGSSLVVVVDNEGVFDILPMGYARTPSGYAQPVLAGITGLLWTRQWVTYVAWLSGLHHPADPWSRPSKFPAPPLTPLLSPSALRSLPMRRIEYSFTKPPPQDVVAQVCRAVLGAPSAPPN